MHQRSLSRERSIFVFAFNDPALGALSQFDRIPGIKQPPEHVLQLQNWNVCRISTSSTHCGTSPNVRSTLPTHTANNSIDSENNSNIKQRACTRPAHRPKKTLTWVIAPEHSTQKNVAC
jgi:hypothetical protein